MTRLVLFWAKYDGVTKDSENKDEDTFLFLSGHRQGAAGQLCVFFQWRKTFKQHSENASGEKRPPAPESKSTASILVFIFLHSDSSRPSENSDIPAAFCA